MSAALEIDAPALAATLEREVDAEIAFDAYSRGRYSTDASFYQIFPLGVVVPKTLEALRATVQVCARAGTSITLRGGGTSQCGQTVGSGVVVDTSKYLRSIGPLDAEKRSVSVQPGVVLDTLNGALKKSGLFFPIDPSTAARATLGGMAANNSSGSHSIRYGIMRDNVLSIDATLASGEALHFGLAETRGRRADALGRIAERLQAIGAREAGELALRFPQLQRRVGGYNLDAVVPERKPPNFAHLLVGSEGTLAVFTAIELALSPLPAHTVLAVVHFSDFYGAMEATQHIVELEPVAVELVDRTMIEQSFDIPIFAPVMQRYVRGRPDALLLVEFSGDELAPLLRKLTELEELLAAHGYHEAVVKLEGAAEQRAMWNVRKAGLDIMSSRIGDAKPVSIIEDCAVNLEHLEDYTRRLNAIFARHGKRGTWYAHAAAGCLHVRPVLNLKDPADVARLRAIAEEAFDIVREYKGSHSGEHGDGLLRSEFHAEMFGERLVRAFEETKTLFDPAGVLNPGKIVHAPKMDDRRLFRYHDGYAAAPYAAALDWSPWNGLLGAAEMCNNNGACRKNDGVMCPSYMVTRDEEHVTRGRANVLRLALTGQLGRDALASDEMAAAMDLCVGCKACKRECPAAVDMSRMKIEVEAARNARRLPVRKRLIGLLPRMAPAASKAAVVLNALEKWGPARAARGMAGVDARRSLPRWSRKPFVHGQTSGSGKYGDVVLLVDTFATYFEPEVARSAIRVLKAAGYRVHVPAPVAGRPLCCGRTALSAGMVDAARFELRRTLDALGPFVRAGTPIVGLEPSCLLTLRDELSAVVPGDASRALAGAALLFEEFVVRERAEGRFDAAFVPRKTTALVHGHCHQKAFAADGAVREALALVPGVSVEAIDSSCCGMAGSFGYERAHFDVSMAMAERSLLPAVRARPAGSVVVADGTSCRHQIADGSGAEALHCAQFLDHALGVHSR